MIAKLATDPIPYDVWRGADLKGSGCCDAITKEHDSARAAGDAESSVLASETSAGDQMLHPQVSRRPYAV